MKVYFNIISNRVKSTPCLTLSIFLSFKTFRNSQIFTDIPHGMRNVVRTMINKEDPQIFTTFMRLFP